MSGRLDRGEDTLTEVHEINVTPFIDVMLVLLIIFMVAAPLATVDIAADLTSSPAPPPERQPPTTVATAVALPSSTAPPQERPPQPLFLTVKPDLTLTLGDDVVARDTLG